MTPRWDEDSEALFACAEQGGALCTVTGIDGSWSRRLGAQLAVLPDGTIRGSLADGCLERALATEALTGDRPRLIRFGKGSPFIDIRLPCGSGIDVVVDPRPDYDAIINSADRLRRREPASLAVSCDGGRSFVREYIPNLRLLIMGSGPEIRALAHLAAATNIEADVAGPIGDRNGDESLVLSQRPERAVDAWTAIAILFHDHEWEAGILPWALEQEAFYIGAQGGAAARQSRLKRLTQLGVHAVL